MQNEKKKITNLRVISREQRKKNKEKDYKYYNLLPYIPDMNIFIILLRISLATKHGFLDKNKLLNSAAILL